MTSVGIRQQTVSTRRGKSPISRGLVLSGGGALAAYEAGVMSALLTGESAATGHKPIDVDVVAATSAGSVNASLFLSVAAQGPSSALDYLRHVWLEEIGQKACSCNGGAFRFRANPSSFFKPACYYPNPLAPFVEFVKDGVFLTEDLVKRGVNFWQSDQDIEQRTLEVANLSALVSDDLYKNLLRKRVRFDKIRSSRTALRIATTNWKSGQLTVFSNNQMTDENGASIILASSAIPGLFSSVEIDGEPYVDGGIVMNTPLKPAIDAGADELHVIYMDAEVAQLPLPRLANTVSALHRSLVIGFSAMIKRDIMAASEINRELARAQGPNGNLPKPILVTRDVSDPRLIARIESNGSAAHRPLTIHRHHPTQTLGPGWFTFSRSRLAALIDTGLKDATEHSCARNQCILPEEAR